MQWEFCQDLRLTPWLPFWQPQRLEIAGEVSRGKQLRTARKTHLGARKGQRTAAEKADLSKLERQVEQQQQ